MTDLSNIILENKQERETRMRQGKVVSIQAGPPRTLTVDISGVNYPGIKVMDHVNPTVGEGIWIMDMGIGRWLCFGTSTSSAVPSTGPNVLKAGDTMTGALTVPGVSISGAAQISLPGGGNSIAFATDGSYISWYNAGFANRRGYLQGNAGGMILSSESGVLSLTGSGGINFSGGRVDFGGYALTGTSGVINGYTMSTGVIGNRIVCTDSSGYIVGNYFNMTAGDSASACDRFVGRNSGSDLYLRWMYNMMVPGQLGSTYWGGTSYSVGAIFANPASQYAQMGFHPGGVAGSIRIANNFGVFAFVDVPGTAYYPIYASAFTVNSRRANKQDIEPWPAKAKSLGAAANTMTALGLVKELEIVSFRRRHDEYMLEAWKGTRRARAHLRLNEFRKNRGLAQYPYRQHDCDDSDCIGTSEAPCPWYRNWEQPHLGLIVEDTVGVAPEIVWMEEDGLPGGIDVHSHVGLLHAAIKELEQRVQELEEQL